ncbi:cytochrome P450, partial [Bombardia bombarda]
NELIFCGAGAWDDIYGSKLGKPDMEKSTLQAGGLPLNIPARALTLAPWDDHVRQRKAWAYPFSNTALLGQEQLVQVYVDKLIANLHILAAEDKPVNMAAWLTHCTFDIIGELCFAEPFGCLDSGKATDWSESVVNIANAGTYEQAMRRVAGVNTWLQRTMAKWLMPTKYSIWRQLHFTQSREKTLRRIADKDREHKDFIYYVFKNAESESSLSELEIVMNTALFTAAGSDTTALFLTAWVNLMLRNPGSYQKLVKEIRGAIKSADNITWATVKDLLYLGAVISETFRSCAPVPTNLCRTVPVGGAFIDGNWVPGGTTVSVSPWAATHTGLNWDQPLSFIPERWLKDEEHRFPCDKKKASQPFSYGPRGCIGKNLANIEQRLIISHLIFHFDIEALGGEYQVANEQWSLDDDMGHLKAYLVWEKPPLWVRLKKVVR